MSKYLIFTKSFAAGCALALAIINVTSGNAPTAFYWLIVTAYWIINLIEGMLNE